MMRLIALWRAGLSGCIRRFLGPCCLTLRPWGYAGKGFRRRNWLAQVLTSEGIAATPWWSGQHRRLDFTGQAVALELKARVLFLPSHPGMTGEDIDRIVARLRLLILTAPG